MDERSVLERLDIVEQKVNALEVLPSRVEALELQIVHLRGEMRDGFSSLEERLTARMTEGDGVIATRMTAMHQELLIRITMVDDSLSTRIIQGDEETRRYMRVLHEDVISRIAAIQEGLRRH